jgi:hypothetical protein
VDQRPRVLHVSVVHRPDDPRIFERECRSLAADGYDVSYLVPGGSGERDGVTLLGLPERPRAERWRHAPEIWAAVRRLRPHVVHVHDPELLALLPVLKTLGPRLVYDMHEYIAQAVKTRHYVPGPARRPLAACVGVAERTLAAAADGVVAVVPEQWRELGGRPALRILLPNYPRFSRFAEVAEARAAVAPGQSAAVGGGGAGGEAAGAAPLRLVHIGTLAETRGVGLMLDVMAEVGDAATLTLGGPFPDPGFEARCRARVEGELAGRVTLLGRVPPAEVPGHLAAADVVWIAGLPTAQYSLPAVSTKLYEGLAAGCAALVPALPGRGEVVERERCGLVVPATIAGHAAGVRALAADRAATAGMGRRGLEAVRERYSWEAIEGRLLDFYAMLLPPRRSATR